MFGYFILMVIKIRALKFQYYFKDFFISILLYAGVISSSPVFATIKYEENLITQASYSKTSKTYKLRFNNLDNYYEVSSVTGDCAFRNGVITSAQNDVNWNQQIGLTSHFNGKQTYLENVPVKDFNGIASKVGRKSDWSGKYGQWLPSGASWRKTGIDTGWYGSQAVNFPTPVAVDGGPESFDITIRMCRGDDGSYINATGHYVTSAVNSMSVTPTSVALQSQLGTIATGHADITLNGFMPSKIDFTSNVANVTGDYALTLPKSISPSYAGQSYDATFQFEYRIEATKPGDFVIPVNITAMYP